MQLPSPFNDGTWHSSALIRVRWYVAGLGTENGMHNFHWHGNVLEMQGHRTDQVGSSMLTRPIEQPDATSILSHLTHIPGVINPRC